VLLISEYIRYGDKAPVALSVGIDCEGVSTGENIIDTFVPHPITNGISSTTVYAGCGIVSYSADVTILGNLSRKTYIDLDNDGQQDSDELIGAPTLVVTSYGSGKIDFTTDSPMWLPVTQPLTDNTLKYFFNK
jgi:hypothetical protein